MPSSPSSPAVQEHQALQDGRKKLAFDRITAVLSSLEGVVVNDELSGFCQRLTDRYASLCEVESVFDKFAEMLSRLSDSFAPELHSVVNAHALNCFLLLLKRLEERDWFLLEGRLSDYVLKVGQHLAASLSLVLRSFQYPCIFGVPRNLEGPLQSWTQLLALSDYDPTLLAGAIYEEARKTAQKLKENVEEQHWGKLKAVLDQLSQTLKNHAISIPCYFPLQFCSAAAFQADIVGEEFFYSLEELIEEVELLACSGVLNNQHLELLLYSTEFANTLLPYLGSGAKPCTRELIQGFVDNGLTSFAQLPSAFPHAEVLSEDDEDDGSENFSDSHGEASDGENDAAQLFIPRGPGVFGSSQESSDEGDDDELGHQNKRAPDDGSPSPTS